MKKLLSILVLAILTSTVAFAQSNKEEIDLYQSIFGGQKKAIVANYLSLEKNDAFWAIYDQYETERKVLGQKRIDLLDSYAKNYEALNDVETNKIIKDAITQKKKLDNLIVKYYKKINKVSGAKVSAQFYQIENFILSSIRTDVLGDIPFIGKTDQ